MIDHGENAEEESQPPSKAVVDAISDESGTNPTDLPPLYDFIDPDALDQLFVDRENSGTVTFTCCGYVITVSDDGEIIVVEK